MPTLIIREPGRVAVRVTVAAGQVLGRDPSCEIVLRDRTVSRRHARLAQTAAGLAIVDLGSTHGMLIDGARVGEAPLRPGVPLHLGSVLLELAAGDDDADAAEEVTIYPPVGARIPATVDDDARRLGMLFELGRAVGGETEPAELCRRVLASLLEAFRCERGVIELSGSGAARRIALGAGADTLVMSGTVRRAIVERGERILLRATGSVPASLVARGVRSAMAAPLRAASGPSGFVYVDDRTRADRFSAAELDLLTAVAHLLAAAVDQARARGRLERRIEAELVPVGELAGESEAMQRLRKEVQRYGAARDTAVLVRGESGSGKELVARSLHASSPRAAGPFVAVNCAAIPDTLLESELFGHERGAFTGAHRTRRGKLVLADGGTLFLDEVGDLSLAAQAKLLRVLEEGEVTPLGAERDCEFDVRVVSATHKALEKEIAAGRFREDLYYRLAVGQIAVPPLRARGEDVVLLAESFLARIATQLGKQMTGFGPDALDALRRYAWPGNVRQLRNEVERAAILADGEIIDELGVPLDDAPAPAPVDAVVLATLDDSERRHIEAALRAHGGNILATARTIGVSRGLLYRKIAKYGIVV